MCVALIRCWLHRDGRKGRVGPTPRSCNTLRKAVPFTQSEGGMDTRAVRTAGPGSVVPMDHPVEAVSRVQYGSVGSTPLTEVQDICPQGVWAGHKGQTPADIWWPASQAAEPHTHPSRGKSQEGRPVSCSRQMYIFFRVSALFHENKVSSPF